MWLISGICRGKIKVLETELRALTGSKPKPLRPKPVPKMSPFDFRKLGDNSLPPVEVQGNKTTIHQVKVINLDKAFNSTQSQSSAASVGTIKDPHTYNSKLHRSKYMALRLVGCRRLYTSVTYKNTQRSLHFITIKIRM